MKIACKRQNLQNLHQMGVLRTNRWIRKIRAYQGPWYPTVTHPGTQPAHMGTQLASYAGARGLTAVLPSWRWRVNFGIRSPVAPMRHVAAGTVGAGTGPILSFWVYSRHVRKVKCICRPSGRSNNQNFKILRVCLHSANHPRTRDRSRIRYAEQIIVITPLSSSRLICGVRTLVVYFRIRPCWSGVRYVMMRFSGTSGAAKSVLQLYSGSAA